MQTGYGSTELTVYNSIYNTDYLIRYCFKPKLTLVICAQQTLADYVSTRTAIGSDFGTQEVLKRGWGWSI